MGRRTLVVLSILFSILIGITAPMMLYQSHEGEWSVRRCVFLGVLGAVIFGVITVNWLKGK